VVVVEVMVNSTVEVMAVAVEALADLERPHRLALAHRLQ
jgi:hypothetical protein